MTTNQAQGRRAFHLAAVAGFTLLLAACVADDHSAQRDGMTTSAAVSQPRYATYDCGEDGRISVESTGSAVRLVDAQGETFDLPASPPTQNSRFGEGGLALVVEGGEALWMRAGKEPLTCRR